MSQEFANIGVGVLGATGFIGVPYRAELRECEDVRIVALCARRRELLEAAAKEDGAELVTNDWREVIAHPAVDFVIVATPDALHHEAVMACAAARKHVFCEKPVSKSVHEAREMYEAYRNAGSLLHFVPFWTRWSPGFVKAKEVVSSGRLGEIQSVVYRWHNPRPANMPLTWRDDPRLSSAGSVADVGSHAYDTVRWLVDDEASRVLTHARTITPSKADLGPINLTEALAHGIELGSDAAGRPGGTADYASVAWAFEGGGVGMLMVSHATYLRRGLAPELELHGTEASLGVDRFHGKVTLSTASGELETMADVGPGGFDIGNRFQQWVIPALQAVMDGADPEGLELPTLKDGWRVQLFTDAAMESSRRGEWVALDEMDRVVQPS